MLLDNNAGADPQEGGNEKRRSIIIYISGISFELYLALETPLIEDIQKLNYQLGKTLGVSHMDMQGVALFLCMILFFVLPILPSKHLRDAVVQWLRDLCR